MEAIVTLPYYAYSSGTSKKTGKDFDLMKCLDEDNADFVTFFLSEEVATKVKALSLAKGDIVNLKLNITISNYKTFINVINVELQDIKTK